MASIIRGNASRPPSSRSTRSADSPCSGVASETATGAAGSATATSEAYATSGAPALFVVFVDFLRWVELVLDGLVAFDVGLGHRVEHTQQPALGLPVLGALDAQLDEHDAAVVGLLVAEPQLPRRLPQPAHLVRAAIDVRLGAQRDVGTVARAQAADVDVLVAIDLGRLVRVVGGDEPQVTVAEPLVLQTHRTRAQLAVALEPDEHRGVELVEQREQLLLRTFGFLRGFHGGEDRPRRLSCRRTMAAGVVRSDQWTSGSNYVKSAS